jgi:hypothetical protein
MQESWFTLRRLALAGARLSAGKRLVDFELHGNLMVAKRQKPT